MLDTVISVRGIPIRLTDERWANITEEHSELAGMRFEILETVMRPSQIYQGGRGELIAIREIGDGKYWAVIYRESELEGFIITAFMTRRIKSMQKRSLLWSPPK